MLQLPCMLVCRFVCANRTRDRGCSKHPVFPAPSKFWRDKRRCKTSGDQRRENVKARSAVIASAAKQCTSLLAALWIASLRSQRRGGRSAAIEQARQLNPKIEKA